VEVAAALREPSQYDEESSTPAWRVSFRSRGKVDVAAIAQKFGGGGHRNAAGCSVEGDEAQVRARIALEIERALQLAVLRGGKEWLSSPAWWSSTSPRARLRSTWSAA
jgi:nanoRNase/pAp phosphatase (c-di-AMP/oligoRNAs hydrolase)